MKQLRVIFRLDDGRKKYATHNGQMLKWDEREVENLALNERRYGKAAYTADFAKYDVVAAHLRERFPDARIVKVVGFEAEVHDLPLRDDVIF